MTTSAPTPIAGGTNVTIQDGVNYTLEAPKTSAPAAAPAAAPVTPAVKAATTTEASNGTAATQLGSTTGATTANPFISTSDSVQSWEDGVTSTLNGLTANNQATTDAHNQYLTTLQNEQTALEARRADQVKQINSSFDAEKTTEEGVQANETGALNVTLQRSGGFLGIGASQTGALINLNQTHINTMQALEAKRQAAIQTASNAIDDKEFALASASAQEAKDYAKAQNDATQQYLQDQIAVHKASQDAQTFAQDQAKSQLTALSTLTPDQLKTVSPATLTNIDNTYGVPGFAKSYIAATQAANNAKSATDALDAQQKLLTLLQDVPKGQKITFPDPANPTGPGTTYTGIGKTADISTFMETDNYGNNTLITYDKGSGTITRSAAGGGGKTSSAVDAQQVNRTALNNIGEFISDPSNKILVPLDPNNPNSPKMMTAANYASMYQKFVKVYPGQGALFTGQYPIEETVIPSQVGIAGTALHTQLATDESKGKK